MNFLNNIILNDLDNVNTNGETGFYVQTGSCELLEQIDEESVNKLDEESVNKLDEDNLENIELNTNSDFDEKFDKNSIFNEI